MKVHRILIALTVLAWAGLAVWSYATGICFRVESRDGRYSARRISLSRGDIVRLVDQLSDAPCRFDRTWGYDRDRVWVDRGCRAEFEITQARNTGLYEKLGGRDESYLGYGNGRRDRAEVIRLESADWRRAEANVGRNAGVRLVRKLSNARCDEGRTWGVRNGRLWVSDGCRADFEVRQ